MSAMRRASWLPPEIALIILQSSQVVRSNPLPWALHRFLPAAAVACPSQRRAFHLYKVARSKTELGNHTITGYDRYSVPPPENSGHKINIREGSRQPFDPEMANKQERPVNPIKGSLIAEGVSLEEAYNEYVQPGHILVPLHPIPENIARQMRTGALKKLPDEYTEYAIHDTEVAKAPKIAKKTTSSNSAIVKHLSAMKEAHLQICSPKWHYDAVMNRSYHQLLAGLVVEMHISISQSKQQVRDAAAGLTTVNPWEGIHHLLPQFRPDFIMKAMPAGTYMAVEPFANSNKVAWVMGNRKKQTAQINYTSRVLQIKDKITKNIMEGRQPNLPKRLRQALINQGVADYSLDTDVPRRLAEEDPRRLTRIALDEVRWGLSSLEKAKKKSLINNNNKKESEGEGNEKESEAKGDRRGYSIEQWMSMQSSDRYMAPMRGGRDRKGKWRGRR